MKKKAIIGFLGIIICVAAINLPHWPVAKPVAPDFRQGEMTIKTEHQSYHFSIEIAETWAEQAYGLMHRPSMARDHGMLFIFSSEQNISMWMRNTILSLDMLFVDSHGKIIYISPNAAPYSDTVISAGRPARAVIELLGGTAAIDDIHTGDTVINPYFTP